MAVHLSCRMQCPWLLVTYSFRGMQKRICCGRKPLRHCRLRAACSGAFLSLRRTPLLQHLPYPETLACQQPCLPCRTPARGTNSSARTCTTLSGANPVSGLVFSSFATWPQVTCPGAPCTRPSGSACPIPGKLIHVANPIAPPNCPHVLNLMRTSCLSCLTMAHACRPDAETLKQRSPINSLESFCSPVIIFQVRSEQPLSRMPGLLKHWFPLA